MSWKETENSQTPSWHWAGKWTDTACLQKWYKVSVAIKECRNTQELHHLKIVCTFKPERRKPSATKGMTPRRRRGKVLWTQGAWRRARIPGPLGLWALAQQWEPLLAEAKDKPRTSPTPSPPQNEQESRQGKEDHWHNYLETVAFPVSHRVRRTIWAARWTQLLSGSETLRKLAPCSTGGFDETSSLCLLSSSPVGGETPWHCQASRFSLA